MGVRLSRFDMRRNPSYQTLTNKNIFMNHFGLQSVETLLSSTTSRGIHIVVHNFFSSLSRPFNLFHEQSIVFLLCHISHALIVLFAQNSCDFNLILIPVLYHN